MSLSSLNKTSLRVAVATSVFCLMMICCGTLSFAKSPPVELKAKSLTHDEITQTVTALGDVEAIQGERIMHADKVVYNLETDTVSAIGNVSLLDESGDVHFAEYIELTGSMKSGFVQGLLSLLTDGSRFTAAEAQREEGVKTILTDATYTPCKVCEANPDPMWQIKADKVIHDEKEKTVKYKNARLELKGVPIAYSPIFSHADPSVKRKSGLVRPLYGWSDDVGTYVEAGYYFADIAPHIDATLRVRPTTRAGTMLGGEWRQRTENGLFQLDGSIVQSDHTKEDGRIEANKTRGYISGNGLFDLNDKWRAGFKVERTSDKEYVRLYDITSKNVLESEAYAERFAGRDYSRISLQDFQDVRLGLRPDQPAVIPRLEHHMIGSPNQTLGGRWDLGLSTLALSRFGDGQDMQRISAAAGWQRQDISDVGFVTKTKLSSRVDYYRIADRFDAALDPTLPSQTNDVRGMVTGTVETSYPLVKRLETSQVVLEPVAGISVSPSIDNDDGEIPNEDSIDIQLDTHNLFAQNRFPGVDRLEGGVRANYGLKAGVYADDGRYSKVFVGQSYRFNEDSAFTAGSGLDENASDVVGQVSAGIHEHLDASYRFQLDGENFNFNRHEVLARGKKGPMEVDVGYIYLAGIAGSDFTETREQLRLGGRYDLNEEWWLNGSVLQDLGEDPGLRTAGFGVNYEDDCFSFGVQGQRNLTDDASGESGTVVMLHIGFKNIGEFTSPQILLNDNNTLSD